MYAGLVHSCRYTGLLDASIAAYQRATRLDPSIRTSVAHSFFMRGEFDRAIELDVDDPPYVTTMALDALGRREEAAGLSREAHERAPANAHLAMVFEAMVALISGDAVAGTAAVDRLVSLPAFSDPEGLYYWAHSCMGFGDHERALELLEKAVDLGMHCVRGLEVTPALEPVRATTRFRAVVDRARAAQTAAEKAFADAQGHQLLGLPRPPGTHPH